MRYHALEQAGKTSYCTRLVCCEISPNSSQQAPYTVYVSYMTRVGLFSSRLPLGLLPAQLFLLSVLCEYDSFLLSLWSPWLWRCVPRTVIGYDAMTAVATRRSPESMALLYQIAELGTRYSTRYQVPGTQISNYRMVSFSLWVIL